TWTQVNTGLTSVPVLSLVINRMNPQILYAGTYTGGVCKSTNGGASWTAMNNGLPVSTVPTVMALAIDPTHPQSLYAVIEDPLATVTLGVFKTSNGGVNWTPLSSGLTVRYVEAFAIDPQTPTTVYAGTYLGGVFKIEQFVCGNGTLDPGEQCDD